MSRHFVKISISELLQKVSLYNKDERLTHLTLTVEKDLQKVEFDCENVCSDADELGGYHTLPNGMSYLGVFAGGDWETAVFFIIYWDGKQLRGYVPTNGNCFNTTTKQAYGNDEVADLKDARKRWPNEQYLKQPDVDLSGWFDADVNLIKKDIMARITEKPLVKPQKTSKVGLKDFTTEQLLAEIANRTKKNGKQ